MQLDFENKQEVLPLTYKLKMICRRAVLETLTAEQYQNPAEVSITFIDDQGIRELNKNFRNIDKATDVLSFPLFDYEGESDEPPVDELVGMLGDVVISLETAKRQAEEYGHSLEEEVAFLTVHSTLHLLGYDHETGAEDEREMFLRQDEIMKRMGFAPRY
ncbi:MAG: rRNA maturation RNase YbeY [Clostridia bacterium]|nr:rRNA maturation RNase YbeY [Clostridia bacterium]